MTSIPKRVRFQKAHLPPGTLVYTGQRRGEKQRITFFDYNAAGFEEKTLADAESCRVCKNRPNVAWINIDGLTETDTIAKIGTDFGIHPLALEDILNTSQRPKFEDYGDYLFMVAKMIGLENRDSLKITTEQVSFIVGKNFLITFQEHAGDVFEPIRQRIRQGKGHVRKMGADYLAYTLIDAIVDNYFVILEQIGEEADLIESELPARADESLMHRIHAMKRRMIYLRRSIWPLREVVGALQRSESPIVAKRTRLYIRDLYDHAIQVIDTVESLRDIAGGMLDTYLSVMGNRMNSVMKVLTIIATIFIPLTFIAGVYGMNFENMPELARPWAYPAVLTAMLLIALGMLRFFKRKGWIS
jgi:magnesium transporter